MRNFYSSPLRNIIHAQIMHSMQGSSPGLWAIRQIQSMVPESQRFSANTSRSSGSFFLHTTRTTRDNHPYSKYSQCLNGRRYSASDLTVSRVYRVENMFWNLLNVCVQMQSSPSKEVDDQINTHFNINRLTYSRKQSASSEVNRFSVSQEIPRMYETEGSLQRL
jgi:hypothetical protein